MLDKNENSNSIKYAEFYAEYFHNRGVLLNFAPVNS